MVIGVSPGVGKSTLARELGTKLNIPVYHLDCFYWNPGWQAADERTFRQRQEQLLMNNTWIIEGNYSDTMDLRITHADTIIYIELPRLVAIYRVLKRWRSNLGKDRPDRAEGCDEQMELSFLKFIWTTYKARKKKLEKLLPKLQAEKNIIQLHSQKDISNFLARINKVDR
jgi:adenylate kinase family enzyme